MYKYLKSFVLLVLAVYFCSVVVGQGWAMEEIINDNQNVNPLGALGLAFVPVISLGHLYAGDWPRGMQFEGIEIGDAAVLLSCIGPFNYVKSTVGGVAALSLLMCRVSQIGDARFTANDRNLLNSKTGNVEEAKYYEYYSRMKNNRVAYNLSMMLPTLGHIYVGDFMKGLNFGLAEVACLAAITPSQPALYIGGTLGYIFLKFWEASDASQAVNEYNRDLQKEIGINWDGEKKQK